MGKQMYLGVVWLIADKERRTQRLKLLYYMELRRGGGGIW